MAHKVKTNRHLLSLSIASGLRTKPTGMCHWPYSRREMSAPDAVVRVGDGRCRAGRLSIIRWQTRRGQGGACSLACAATTATPTATRPMHCTHLATLDSLGSGCCLRLEHVQLALRFWSEPRLGIRCRLAVGRLCGSIWIRRGRGLRVDRRAPRGCQRLIRRWRQCQRLIRQWRQRRLQDWGLVIAGADAFHCLKQAACHGSAGRE